MDSSIQEGGRANANKQTKESERRRHHPLYICYPLQNVGGRIVKTNCGVTKRGRGATFVRQVRSVSPPGSPQFLLWVGGAKKQIRTLVRGELQIKFQENRKKSKKTTQEDFLIISAPKKGWWLRVASEGGISSMQFLRSSSPFSGGGEGGGEFPLLFFFPPSDAGQLSEGGRKVVPPSDPEEKSLQSKTFPTQKDVSFFFLSTPSSLSFFVGKAGIPFRFRRTAFFGKSTVPKTN